MHVAIIMDGNGRWATARGRPRLEGHRAGATAARAVIEAAPALGVRALTLFGFSSDNWRRPRHEVRGLMALIAATLQHEAETCARRGVRIRVIGRRDRLPRSVSRAVRQAERMTAGGGALDLRIALDYSSRDAIAQASHALEAPGASRDAFARALGRATGTDDGPLDVDLLIRTGGEQRLSDFLLWECAYAEIVFSRRMWPEFTPEDLAGAVADFAGRERRFGALPAGAPG